MSLAENPFQHDYLEKRTKLSASLALAVTRDDRFLTPYLCDRIWLNGQQSDQ